MGRLGILIALLLSLVNYGVRFVRWEWFTRRLGYRIALLFNAHVYFAGLTMTATPGKAGELVRSVFLKKEGMDYHNSIGLFLAERITDLIAVTVMASLVFLQFKYGLTVFATTAFMLLLVCIIVHSPVMRRFVVENVFTDSSRKLDKTVHHIIDMLASTERLLDVPGYSGALLFGLISWSAEAFAFWFLASRLGYEVSLPLMMSIYSFAMMAGAVSFLPGGIGAAEVAMFFLLKNIGVADPDALSLTLVSRITTLWFAVLIGLPSFLYLGIKKRDE